VLTHFVLTCGVAPREWRSKICYLTRSNMWCNMYILDGTLCFGNPEAKQVSQYVGECLWACTEMVSPLCLFEMSVMRPLVTEVLGMLHVRCATSRHPLFTHTYPKARGWMHSSLTAVDVNLAVQRLTSTLPIN